MAPADGRCPVLQSHRTPAAHNNDDNIRSVDGNKLKLLNTAKRTYCFHSVAFYLPVVELDVMRVQLLKFSERNRGNQTHLE